MAFLHKFTCRMCGNQSECFNPDDPQVRAPYVAEFKAREADSLCTKCAFWLEKTRWAATGTTEAGNPVARVDGLHYVLKPYAHGNVHPATLGLGGAVLTFVFGDGREITSNNVWVQGIIPELWRPRLPDNAEIKRPARATAEALAS